MRSLLPLCASLLLCVSPIVAQQRCDVSVGPSTGGLAAARDSLRAHLLSLAGQLQQDYIICLESGMYDVSVTPFALDGRDSVTGGEGRVVWRGQPGTVLSGGLQIVGWSPTNVLGGTNTFVAPAPVQV